MSLTKDDWKVLLRRIHEGNCTIFVGSELSSPTLPKRSELARKLADLWSYPFDDADNLPRVTQFGATKPDDEEARYQVKALMEAVKLPDFHAPGEVHGVLARLPLSVYLTTAYDDFLVRALETCRPIPRSPRMDYCRWVDSLQEMQAVGEPGAPNATTPLVYHLHGTLAIPESLVLTEDNYLDYLTNTSHHMGTNRPLPPQVLQAFRRPSLLFFGYRLEDLEFRVLLRTIARQLLQSGQRYCIHLIQVDSEIDNSDIGNGTNNKICNKIGNEKENARLQQLNLMQEYLDTYCSRNPFSIHVCWISARAFLEELESRYSELYG